MSALLSSTLSCCLTFGDVVQQSSKSITATKYHPPLTKSRRSSTVVPAKACFLNPFEQEPVLKEALKAWSAIHFPFSVRAENFVSIAASGRTAIAVQPVRGSMKEPVAFMGGVFAGFLRLDLNDDPLKDWLRRTVEASGITEEEVDSGSIEPEDEIPQQINIE